MYHVLLFPTHPPSSPLLVPSSSLLPLPPSSAAGKPKKPGALITICLMLGPDFISDTIVVETSDHARLKVAVAMNNVFRVCKVNVGGHCHVMLIAFVLCMCVTSEP